MYNSDFDEEKFLEKAIKTYVTQKEMGEMMLKHLQSRLQLAKSEGIH